MIFGGTPLLLVTLNVAIIIDFVSFKNIYIYFNVTYWKFSYLCTEIMKKQDNTYRYIAEYYSMHHDELCAFAAKRLKFAYEAEDIVHNVFLKLLTVDKMITPVTLPCLVYTMMRNLIFDNWRHHKSIGEYEHVLAATERFDRQDAASVYSASELNQLLERGIARLSDRQREVYRMNVIDGMKVSEISLTLKIGYKSTEHRLGEARKEVRGYLARMLA